ncbi:Epsin-3, clathrin recruitment and traffic between the Golgi and endosome [Malassezia sp. CBS 17886]|nr:Epsin-3, clathrin recruitment and traffic between the Golgi and endosome [Malassezia sp. CBS 17886]
MDLEEIGDKLSNLTFYDLKSYYTQAKNYALNISDIEAKVREATNDDPCHDFNEIMPTIFRRFMEKEASDWRQIYKVRPTPVPLTRKALQLLEYIVKHGAERVVDEARMHLSTVKILRNFHYIDERGKDQGINIRNRAKELAALLADVDMIRTERRKARANRNKYQGAGNADFVPGSGGGRYGGFSSESYYAGDGARDSVGASTYASASDPAYDEYDAGDDDRTAAPTSAASTVPSAPPVADLFSFDDEAADAVAQTPTGASGAAASAPADDFDDFQAAPAAPPAHVPSSVASAPAAQPAAAKSGGNLFDLLDDSFAAPPTTQKPSSSTFDDLWATSRGKPLETADKGKRSMADLAKDQTSNSVWASASARPAPTQAQSKDLFDLL